MRGLVITVALFACLSISSVAAFEEDDIPFIPMTMASRSSVTSERGVSARAVATRYYLTGKTCTDPNCASYPNGSFPPTPAPAPTTGPLKFIGCLPLTNPPNININFQENFDETNSNSILLFYNRLLAYSGGSSLRSRYMRVYDLSFLTESITIDKVSAPVFINAAANVTLEYFIWDGIKNLEIGNMVRVGTTARFLGPSSRTRCGCNKTACGVCPTPTGCNNCGSCMTQLPVWPAPNFVVGPQDKNLVIVMTCPDLTGVRRSGTTLLDYNHSYCFAFEQVLNSYWQPQCSETAVSYSKLCRNTGKKDQTDFANAQVDKKNKERFVSTTWGNSGGSELFLQIFATGTSNFAPTTVRPTIPPTTAAPSKSPTKTPTTKPPMIGTAAPTTEAPSTAAPATAAPTTKSPTRVPTAAPVVTCQYCYTEQAVPVCLRRDQLGPSAGNYCGIGGVTCKRCGSFSCNRDSGECCDQFGQNCF